MKRVSDAGVLLGAIALGGALLLFMTVLARSMVLDPVTVPAAAVSPEATTPAAAPAATPEAPAVRDEAGATADEAAPTHVVPRPAAEPLASEVLRLAVERAPFQPDRRAPPERYRMPDDPVDAPPPVRAELPPPPGFRVLGTITDGGAGIAVLQVEDGTPHMMTTGEQLFGYTLARIEEGEVTMVGQGRSVNLALAEPMPTGPATATEEGSARAQRQRQAESAAAVVAAARERALEMARQMQERTGGQVQVEMDGNQILLTGPDGQQRRLQVQQGVRTTTTTTIRRGGGGGGDLYRDQQPQQRPPGGG